MSDGEEESQASFSSEGRHISPWGISVYEEQVTSSGENCWKRLGRKPETGSSSAGRSMVERVLTLRIGRHSIGRTADTFAIPVDHPRITDIHSSRHLFGHDDLAGKHPLPEGYSFQLGDVYFLSLNSCLFMEEKISGRVRGDYGAVNRWIGED